MKKHICRPYPDRQTMYCGRDRANATNNQASIQWDRAIGAHFTESSEYCLKCVAAWLDEHLVERRGDLYVVDPQRLSYVKEVRGERRAPLGDKVSLFDRIREEQQRLQAMEDVHKLRQEMGDRDVREVH